MPITFLVNVRNTSVILQSINFSHSFLKHEMCPKSVINLSITYVKRLILLYFSKMGWDLKLISMAIFDHDIDNCLLYFGLSWWTNILVVIALVYWMLKFQQFTNIYIHPFKYFDNSYLTYFPVVSFSFCYLNDNNFIPLNLLVYHFGELSTFELTFLLQVT